MSSGKKRLASPQLSSTPQNNLKVPTLRRINYNTPHIPVAGLGIEKIDRRKIPRNLNISNDGQTDVSSVSRRTVLQPKRYLKNVTDKTDWVYHNSKHGAHELTQQSNKKQLDKTKDVSRKRRKNRVWKEIRLYQKSTDLLIRKLPFARVVRSLAVSACGPHALELKWQAVCFLALQEATEALIVHLFECAQRCALHAGRVTVMPKDVHLVAFLQNIQTSNPILSRAAL